MATQYTSLLGFALPVTGELSGTWGDTVNDSITKLVEDSVAGTATASVASGDWTLTTTGSGQANEARCAILRPTGSSGSPRNIIAPSSSKAYIVDNQSNVAVTIKGVATVGVAVAAGTAALVAWNGSDFELVAQDLANATGTLAVNKGGTGQTSYTDGQLLIGNTATGGLTKATLTAGSNVTITNSNGGITIAAAGAPTSVSSISFGSTGLTPSTATTGAVTVAGTLAVGNGGTGATTLTGILKGNGTSAFSAAVSGTDIKTVNSTSLLGSGDVSVGVTSVGGTGSANGLSLSGSVTSTGNLTLSGTSYTANNVLLGNGTSAFQAVAPGTSGNVLTSNGTTWTSAAAPSNFPLTLVNSTTITSSTSFYERTGLGSYSDYILYIYFLNCTAGSPGGYIITSSGTVDWTNSAGTRYYMTNFMGSTLSSGNDQGNRIWLNSGPLMYLIMPISGFGTRYVYWQSIYNSADPNGYYGRQYGRADAGAGNTCTGFRVTFPAAATAGIIQLYRRG